MSGIIDRLNSRKKKRQEIKDDPSSVDPNESLSIDKEFEKSLTEDYSKPKEELDPLKKSYDLSGSSFAGDPTLRDKASSELQMEMYLGTTSTDASRERFIDPNSWSAEYVHQDFLSNSADNIAYGVGQMVGSYGDIAQYVGSALPGINMREGNIISRALQDVGEDIKQSNTTYIPEEIMDPKFELSTFMNPKFWSTHGARFVPQLIEILGTGALAGGAKKLGQAGLKGLAKGALKSEGKATTRALYGGAKGITEVQGTGKGLLGKVMTDRGTFTKSFGDIYENVAGGAITNMRVSLANAGEVYNTYKDMKDENGNPMFTEEQLGDMASSTFANNMAYMGFDILSWGMTYGKGWDKLNQAKGMLNPNNLLNGSTQRKYISGLFTKSNKPAIAKLFGKAIPEGAEEMVQESWEEWAKIRAYEDQKGDQKGYEGLSKEYDNFFDFFVSDDNEATRTISFALGAMGGGLFNVKTILNKSAEDNVNMYNRAENLKTMFQKGTEGSAMQDYFIRSQMSELIFENKGDAFVGFIKDLEDNDMINSDDVERYSELFDNISAEKDKINSLNIKGKKAYVNNIVDENFYSDALEIEKEKSDNNISILKEQLSDDPEALARAIKKEQANFESIAKPLALKIAKAKENKSNLLQGKHAKPNGFKIDKDEFGNEHIVDDPVEGFEGRESRDSESNKKTTFSSKLKSIFNKVLSSVGLDKKSDSDEEITSPDDDISNLESRDDEVNPNYIYKEDELENNIPSEKKDPKEDTFVKARKANIPTNKFTINDLDKNNFEVNVGSSMSVYEKDDSGDYFLTDMFSNKNVKELPFENSKSAIKLASKKIYDKDKSLLKINLNKDDLGEKISFNKVLSSLKKEGFLTSQKDEDGNLFYEANEDKVKSFEQKESPSIQKKDKSFSSKVFGKSKESYKSFKKFEKDLSNDSSLSVNEKEFIKESIISDNKSSKTISEILQDEVKIDEDNLFNTGRESRISSAKDIIENNKIKSRKLLSFLGNSIKNMFNRIVNSNEKFNETYLRDKENSFDNDSLQHSQMIAVNDKLSQIYPDSKPRAYIVEDLHKVLGSPAVGYTVNSAILIEKDKWNQGETLMHEMSHIHYALTKDLPETKNFLKTALRNKDLVDKILNDYEDQIQYEFKSGPYKGQRIKRIDLFPEGMFNSLSKEERDIFVEEQLEKSNLEEIPLSEQEVIVDEVFAHTLQGPLSKKYNKFFEPKNESVRQYRSKKWWNRIKNDYDNAKKTYDFNDVKFLESLNPDEKIEYSNLKEYILNQFNQATEGQDVSTYGREQRLNDLASDTTNKLISNKQKIQKDQEYYLKNKEVDKDLSDEDVNEIENLSENYDYEDFFTKNAIKYNKKISSIIRDFSNIYSKYIRGKYVKDSEGNITDYNKYKPFDRDQLQITLFNLVNESHSGPDFIRRVEDSTIEEIIDFNRFLNKVKKDDKYMLLNSMRLLYSNQSNINSIQTFVDNDGNFKMQNSLNNKEISTLENITSKIYKTVSASIYKGKSFYDRSYLDMFNEYKQAKDRILSGKYTDEDVRSILNYLSNSQVNVKAIMEDGSININGKNYDLDFVVRSLLKSSNGLKNDSIGPNNKPKLESGTRTFIESLIATNRKFTADYTINNAEGNQEPIRLINNFLVKHTSSMNKDGKRMSKRQFFKKYANISKNFKEGGNESNLLLNHIYDSIQKHGRIDLNQNHGIKNNSTGNSSIIKNSSASEQSLNNFMIFLSSGDNRNNYMMELGRFSDSNKSFMMNVPKIKLSDVGAYSNGTIKFNRKQKAFIKNAFKIYDKLSSDMSGKMENFQKAISNDIKDEIDFVNKNYDSFKKNKNFKDKFTSGKLNKKGENLVAEFVINESFNGIYFNEIFFPDYSLSKKDANGERISGDRDKRAKSGASPAFFFEDNVQTEILYFEDPKSDNFEITDGSAYILEEDAQRIEKEFGSVMPLGYGFKFINSGIENNNSKFLDKNMYDKPYATILNQEVIDQNPRLEKIYNALKKRREIYNEKEGNIEESLTSGLPTYLSLAIPRSSNKSNNLPENYDEQILSIDNIDSDEAMSIYNDWYYKKDEDTSLEYFEGLKGSNLGIQQVMDQKTIESNTPVQLLRAITTNGTINGNLKDLEYIQRLISEIEQDQLAEVVDILNNGSNEDIRNLIESYISKDKMDQTQRLLIDDNLNFTTPALREIAKNTLSTVFKTSGNRLKTPGTVAQTKPTFYSKPYGETNGSSTLAFYSQKSDGSSAKAEIVMPKYMEDKVRSRKTILIDSEGNVKTDLVKASNFFTKDQISKMSLNEFLKASEQLAKQESKRLGVGYGTIMKNDKTVGYYVEGDTVIASRIPSHGPQSTGVFEVIDFDPTGGSQVQLPNEFLNVIGGDHDGDQVFIQHKGRNARWNEAFDKIVDHWLSPEMAEEIKLDIEFKEEAEEAIAKVNKAYNIKKEDKLSLHFSPKGRRTSYNNTLISKGNVGITANLHGLIGLMSSYDTPLKNTITINGVEAKSFKDSKEESRTINSAKLFNIILDNAKYGYADSLGLNENTVSHALILRNLGFSLGDIGIILNSEIAKEWSILADNKMNVFNEKDVSNISQIIRTKYGLGRGSFENVNVNTKDPKAEGFNSSVMNLIDLLNAINSDITSISKIMSGHKDLESNPFIAEDHLKRFYNVYNNADEVSFSFSDDLRNNPLIKNYFNVATENLKNQRRFDPVYNSEASKIYNQFIDNNIKKLNDPQKRKVYSDLELFHTSRILGLNNVPKDYVETLIKNNHKNNIYDRLSIIIDDLSKTPLKIDENNIYNSVTALDNSLLFTKAIRYSLTGNNKFISLNNNFFNDSISEAERDIVIEEFNNLDDNLIKDLILYDMINTGWKGPQSLFHLFSKPTKEIISEESSESLRSIDKVSPTDLNKLEEYVIKSNSDLIREVKTNPFIGKQLNLNLPKSILNRIGYSNRYNPNSTYLRYGDNVYVIRPWTKEQIAEFKSLGPKKSKEIMPKMAYQNSGVIKLDNRNNFQKKMDISLIPDSSTNNFLNEDLQKRTIEKGDQNPSGRFARMDWYNFDKTMKKEEYDQVMEYPSNISDELKEVNYQNYLDQRSESKKIYNELKPDIDKKSDNQLLKLYEKYGSNQYDKFAYSNVLNLITNKLTNRLSKEQSELTGKEYNGKDISALKSWLMANNVPSNHPAVQGMVRKLEVEYKNYLNERSRYVSQINKATDDLYEEKFGFKLGYSSFKNAIKTLYYGLFKNKENFYNDLYGNIIETREIQTDSGKRKEVKFKSRETIESEKAKGMISDAEYNFYNIARNITDELQPYALKNNPGRKDYIPHTSPGLMEALSRRGLLGLAINSKNIDDRILDVKMKVKNPVTNEEVFVPFSEIKNWYNLISKNNGKSLEKTKEYLLLKNKAIRLLKKGENSDGSKIDYSPIETSSAIGDVFMDRFSKSRSVKAEDFPSMDLNKAFNDYINGALFTHGNQNFKGMKNMLPFVDGVLAQADRRGDKNMAKYVDKVWKQYFLSGKKQQNIPTPIPLQTLGITTDETIDFITKGSLMYWLGYKGLAIGSGAYAIGNILAGKYANIKNAGGESYAKGEKRFWMGIDGTVDITDPFKGIRESNEILKNLGFMDINLYDDVNVTKKNSFENMFMGLALMPMAKSERWIQGSHFLGLLTDNEWDYVKNGGRLSNERMTEIENEVKESHGKGYQPTDQRMIQMYSWGRSMMQFSRYLPTVFHDRLGQEDINIYGKKHIGAYRAMWKPIQKLAMGEITPKEFANYRRSLDSDERKRLDSGLIGFGLVSGIIALNMFVPTSSGHDLISDANILFESDRLQGKLKPPSVKMIEDLLNI